MHLLTYMIDFCKLVDNQIIIKQESNRGNCDLADPAQIVAQQVHDHQVLSLVLLGSGQGKG